MNPVSMPRLCLIRMSKYKTAKEFVSKKLNRTGNISDPVDLHNATELGTVRIKIHIKPVKTFAM